jgi:hypothetical protein
MSEEHDKTIDFKELIESEKENGNILDKIHDEIMDAVCDTEYAKHDFWTYIYEPFTMGGSVWRPATAALECLGPYDLGAGYQGYLSVSPLTGKWIVCESDSCAIVGHSLDEVRKDIAEGDADVMKMQVEHAIMEYRKASRVEPDKFWEKMRNAK